MFEGSSYNDPVKVIGKADLNKVIEKVALDHKNMIVDTFLAKNTEKLSLLIGKKTGIKSFKVVYSRVKSGVLENKILFEFDDNSSFEIYSTVVYSYSNKGTFFVRMPTRFTNVKLANGSMMKGPSEEKMIKEF